MKKKPTNKPTKKTEKVEEQPVVTNKPSQFRNTVGRKTNRGKGGVVILNKESGDLIDESRKTHKKNHKLANYITKVFPDE